MLHELVFTGNPLHEKFMEDNGGDNELWKGEVQRRLKPLKKLDGKFSKSEKIQRSIDVHSSLGFHCIRDEPAAD